MSDIDALIRAAAERYNLDHGIFRNQLVAESGLNPNAINARSGAAGIGQFMPATARGLGIDPMDPAQAIPAAALYMRQNLNRFGGDYTHALAAYNWGPGNVAKHGVENMPAETQNYVGKILSGGSGATPIPVPPIPPPGGPSPATEAGAPSVGPPWPMVPPTLPGPLGDSTPTTLADALTQAARRGQGLA